jgi:hypothetical protein
MKTRVFFLVLFVVATLFVFGQDGENAKVKKFWYGFKFGLDADSKTTNIDELQEQLKGNCQAGVFMQFGRKLYLQPELYYSTYKISESGLSLSGNNTATSINYIKAPILIGLKFLDLGLVAAHIDGGATFLKELDNSQSDITYKWTVGAGVYVLGFITADVRYQFQNKVNATEIQDLISNGGTVNLTVGIRL